MVVLPLITNLKSEASTSSKPKPQLIPTPASVVNTSEPSNDPNAFNKDVTSDVELITSDRNTTLMFLKNYKFTKYFENKTHISYRCINHGKQATECLARIKHNTECGEVLMRSEHNHPSDESTYNAFLSSAVKVRKFTKKPPRPVTETASGIESKKSLQSSLSDMEDSFHDMGDFALAIGRIQREREETSELFDTSIDDSLLIEIKEEKMDD